MAKIKITNIFKKYFVTGMVVIVPLWVTILLLKAVISLVNNTFNLLPPSVHPKTYLPFFGVELIIALLLIIIVGLIASNFFGKKLLRFGEIILNKIPVIKTIYQAVKHLTTGIVSERKIFSRAVLLEFPIKGLSFIGFVTGESTDEIAQQSGKKLLKIFIPTTPNPTSGFFCFASEEDVINLDLTVDEAFKMIISAGYSDVINI